MLRLPRAPRRRQSWPTETKGLAIFATSNGARTSVPGAVYAGGVDNCGVVALSQTGAPLRITNTELAALPTKGEWAEGDFVNIGGALWFCVQGGTPGQWRLLASDASAGAFVPITPARVYDSRKNNAVNAATGPLTSGGNRLVSVANAYTPHSNTVAIPNVVPAGARAVAINLTVTGPSAPGFMFIAPGGTATATGSSINWSAAQQTIANGLIVGPNTVRQLKAFLQISGGVGTSDFLIDVNGYFLGN